jgi:hypothetical protein
MNPDKLAGVDLTAGEPFMAPEAILEGSHRPRGEMLYRGKELIMEIYEDDPATFAITDPFPFDEYVLVLSGKLILTDAGGRVRGGKYTSSSRAIRWWFQRASPAPGRCSGTTANWSP